MIWCRGFSGGRKKGFPWVLGERSGSCGWCGKGFAWMVGEARGFQVMVQEGRLADIGGGKKGVLADDAGKERVSRRLSQIRAQIDADFLLEGELGGWHCKFRRVRSRRWCAMRFCSNDVWQLSCHSISQIDMRTGFVRMMFGSCRGVGWRSFGRSVFCPNDLGSLSQIRWRRS